MSQPLTITECLLDQCRRYPALEPQDLIKALHQSVYGCGHLVGAAEEGVGRIREEMESARGDAAGAEMLAGAYCRLPLAWARKLGMKAETVFALFAYSARTPSGTAEELEAALTELEALAQAGRLPWTEAAVGQAVQAYRQAGCPICRHTPAFHQAYEPAYRVIRREYVWLLPLLGAIDRKRDGTNRLLVALEGGSASGKTTLAALLEAVYGCSVFHMDDFFLRPEQRTPERYAQPGGNVDRERFWQEVLEPLRRGADTIAYRRYDCQSGRLLEPAAVAVGSMAVVEGAYSLHPDLAPAYDLRVFLDIDPALQKARIFRRNVPPQRDRFFDTWIPLEQAYFQSLDPKGQCDLVLEVEA